MSAGNLLIKWILTTQGWRSSVECVNMQSKYHMAPISVSCI